MEVLQEDAEACGIRGTSLLRLVPFPDRHHPFRSHLLPAPDGSGADRDAHARPGVVGHVYRQFHLPCRGGGSGRPPRHTRIRVRLQADQGDRGPRRAVGGIIHHHGPPVRLRRPGPARPVLAPASLISDGSVSPGPSSPGTCSSSTGTCSSTHSFPCTCS